MHTLDPHSWRNWGGSNEDQPSDPNGERLLHFGLVVALCAFLGSFSPPGVAPLAIAGLLHIAALGLTLAAVLHQDPLLDSATLTRWDEAAACLLLSFALRVLAPVPAQLLETLPG